MNANSAASGLISVTVCAAVAAPVMAAEQTTLEELVVRGVSQARNSEPSVVRDPLSLLDARVGLSGGQWTVTAWGKNLTDKKYNAEFSPGGFLFRALPRRYGVELDYRF